MCLFKSILSTMCSFHATCFVLNIEPNVCTFVLFQIPIFEKLFMQSLNILITLSDSLYSTLSSSFSSTRKKSECLLVSKFTIVPHFVNLLTVVWLSILLRTMMTFWKSSELSVLMLLFLKFHLLFNNSDNYQYKGPFRKYYWDGGGGFPIFTGEILVPPYKNLHNLGAPLLWRLAESRYLPPT